MGALRQPRLTEPAKKPPAAEVRKLDQYGRDPESASERLRARSDFAAETGYTPTYDAIWADLPRLTSGNVCTIFIGIVNMLSLGRQRPAKAARHVWTEPISAVDLAELCRANVRDIQRQLSELQERGLIAVKTIKNGAVKYSISLLYPKWRELDDYAVWKRRQVVEIDSVDDDELEDEEQTEISKDAVHLTRKPQAVRPGRASRAVKVAVGVRELSFQNDSPSVDAQFQAVVTSGRLVVSATFAKGESEAKGEEKGNAERHPCRALPPNAGSPVKPAKGEIHPRAARVCKIFDPLLSRWGSPLLAMDPVALQKACNELGTITDEFLTHWLMRPDGRGSRRISGALAVAAIIREARQNWEAQSASHAEVDSKVARCECGEPVAVDGQCWTCHG